MFAPLSDLSHYLSSFADTAANTMEKMSRSRSRTLFVVDSKNRILGAISDGDIRRSLLAGRTLETPVGEIMNRDPVVVLQDKIDSKALEAICEQRHIQLIPVVDARRILVSILSYQSEAYRQKIDNPVVIMVGGQGSRLGALTLETPKPLLKVGGKAILQIILERLAQVGFQYIYLCVNYRREMIEAFCGDGEKFGLKIRYVREPKKMGTLGAVGLIRSELKMPFLVMNGDLLTALNHRHLLDFHRSHQPSMTVAIRGFPVSIPYGVFEINETEVVSILEKPVFNYSINAGIYALDPSVLDRIPEGENFDITDLMKDLKEAGKKIAAFPVPEYWLDIGLPDDYERAKRDYFENFEERSEKVAGE